MINISFSTFIKWKLTNRPVTHSQLAVGDSRSRHCEMALFLQRLADQPLSHLTAGQKILIKTLRDKLIEPNMTPLNQNIADQVSAIAVFLGSNPGGSGIGADLATSLDRIRTAFIWARLAAPQGGPISSNELHSLDILFFGNQDHEGEEEHTTL